MTYIVPDKCKSCAYLKSVVDINGNFVCWCTKHVCKQIRHVLDTKLFKV